MRSIKINRVLQIGAALILGLGPATGQAQVYTYSGPINGNVEVALSPDGFGEGCFAAVFGTVNETLYYNPATQVLQQVGSVTVTPASQTFDILGSWVDDPGGSGSATLTVGNNGTFSFDFFSGGSLSVPISGSGVYDGQSFSGSWDLQIPMETDILAVSPTSLSFSESPLFGAPDALGGVEVNGVSLENGTSDGTYYVSWEQNTVVAAAVPDQPNTLALLGLGVSPLLFRRCRGSV